MRSPIRPAAVFLAPAFLADVREAVISAPMTPDKAADSRLPIHGFRKAPARALRQRRS